MRGSKIAFHSRYRPHDLLEIHFVAVDVAGDFAADFGVGFVDDGLHRFVLRGI